jgi:hypothetical protein
MMRFERSHWTYMKDLPSQRKIAAAKRAVERQKENLGLFRDIIPVETVDERLQRINKETNEMVTRQRQATLKRWRIARGILRDLPDDIRQKLLAEWNFSLIPADPGYLLDFLWDKGYKREQTHVIEDLLEKGFKKEHIDSWIDGKTDLVGNMIERGTD